eukprot:UN23224
MQAQSTNNSFFVRLKEKNFTTKNNYIPLPLILFHLHKT